MKKGAHMPLHNLSVPRAAKMKQKNSSNLKAESSCANTNADHYKKQEESSSNL